MGQLDQFRCTYLLNLKYVYYLQFINEVDMVVEMRFESINNSELR